MNPLTLALHTIFMEMNYDQNESNGKKTLWIIGGIILVVMIIALVYGATQKSLNKADVQADTVTQKNIEVEVPLNPTEALGRDFFTKYVELRQSGLNNDQKAVDTVATQLIKEGVAKVSQPKSYTSKDIVIIPVGTTVDATKLYAENLVKILKSWMPVKNEAEIAMEAFEKGDMDLLKGIDPIILGYKTALTKLLATPVVQPLAESHLDLINAISLQAFNAKGLRNSDEDPLTGLAAISLEIKSLEAIATAIGKMQSHFASSGIVFNLPISGSILQSQ
jgi:hypothetical protein